MKKTATTIRCVPRYGYEGTDVRTIDLDLADSADEPELAKAVGKWFDERGIAFGVVQAAENFESLEELFIIGRGQGVEP